MAFCPQCGKQQADGATFCASCGSPMGATQPAAPPQPPSQPQFQSRPQPQTSASPAKSFLKILLYIIIGIAALFGFMVIYYMVTDKNVKSETKINPPQTVSPQNPAVAPSGQQPANLTTGAGIPATLRIVAVEVGSGFDTSKYKVTNASETFSAAQLSTLHAVVYVEGVTSSITAKGEWVYLKTRESVVTNDVSLDRDGAFHYELSKPSNGWPAGEYALKVYVNAKELAYKKFIVQ